MKTKITHLLAAGALALAAWFPVAASAEHGHGHGHHGHGHGHDHDWNDHGGDWDDGDWDDHGPRWIGHDSWSPSYGAYVAPGYGYYQKPYQCYAPGYGWYPCPYAGYGY